MPRAARPSASSFKDGGLNHQNNMEPPSPAKHTLFDQLPDRLRNGYTKAILANRYRRNLSSEGPLTLEEKETLMSSICLYQNPDGKSPEDLIRGFRENEPNVVLVEVPPPDVECLSKEFDNIKVFYHLDKKPLFGTGSYRFYIARPGAEPKDCFDWRKENIKVTAMGYGGNWGECFRLQVPGGSQIRIHYPDPNRPGVVRTQDCRFPVQESAAASWPTGLPMFHPPSIHSENILHM